MSKGKQHKVRKGDLARVVLTETAPYEVPLMFSNHGFYKHCTEYLGTDKAKYPLTALFDRLVANKKEFFIPFAYKIKKDDLSSRRLSLLHPAAQFRFIEFYQKYHGLICHYCSGSPASIRYPQKVGATYFLKNESKNINKYKQNSIDTTYTEIISKHSSSYFSYGGYDRLYKFFNSQEFLGLEERYRHLWTLDVSKCFDSIYTHSISWALKSKDFIKEHLNSASFGESFDRLMQAAKHNETNGIVIGPEVSRIFAEIIFQDIDVRIVKTLEIDGVKFNRDYSIRRYVDDFIIFAKTEVIAQKVARAISSNLMEYNLHINEAKFEKIIRPFFTKKSRVVYEAGLLLHDFIKKFTKEDQYPRLIPIKVRHPIRLKRNFLDAIKNSVSSNEGDYSLISNYLISSLGKRIVSLVENGAKQISDDAEMSAQYMGAVSCILEVMFFLYTVEPTVNASYHLCRSIILATRFFQKELPEYETHIKQRILELFVNFYDSSPLPNKTERRETTPLEHINILLALADMGEDYLVSEQDLEDIFMLDKSPHYFELMSCLYYIRAYPFYQNTRDKIKNIIRQRLANLTNIPHHAEEVYIFLDTLTCPYFGDTFKTELLELFNRQMQLNINIDAALLEYIGANPWFINWVDIDLLNLLEKRELSAVY